MVFATTLGRLVPAGVLLALAGPGLAVTAVGSPVATAPGAAATAVALVPTARALRAGAEVADDAVTVRSWWRTRRFPRREVVGAATASHGEHWHGGTPARLLARQASRITGAHDVTVDGGRWPVDVLPLGRSRRFDGAPICGFLRVRVRPACAGRTHNPRSRAIGTFVARPP